jgi:esterase/lipase superfamily enzyme
MQNARLCGTLVSIVVVTCTLFACLDCAAADDNSELLTPYLHGTVRSKIKDGVIADALVILAKQSADDQVRYEAIASVVTDSDGVFLFADPHLWEKERHLTLLVWKRLYSWGERELTEGFYAAPRKESQDVYLPPLWLDQGKCPTCAIDVPPSHQVQVLYATDRAPSDDSAWFQNKPDAHGNIHYGICNAGIEPPSERDPIKVDKGFASDLQPYATANELFSALKTTPDPGVLMFIHGYQNSFKEACGTAAQVAYDTGFRGNVVIFSWPSKEKVGGYRDDEGTIAKSTSHVTEFLKAVSSSVDARVNVLAHSMGNRALLAAVAAVGNLPTVRSHLGNLVFVAADVDSVDFKTQVSPGLPSKRATLYASSHDMALWASKVVYHDKKKRAGDADPEIDIMPHLDSVDASLVDTALVGWRNDDLPRHSYYRTSWTVISDLEMLISYNMPPDLRGLEAKQTKAKEQYWILKPQHGEDKRFLHVWR